MKQAFDNFFGKEVVIGNMYIVICSILIIIAFIVEIIVAIKEKKQREQLELIKKLFEKNHKGADEG